MEKKKVAFFFGAGAEQGNNNFDMPTGFQYMHATMFDEELKKNVSDALDKFLKEQKYFNNSYKYKHLFITTSKLMLQNLLVSKSLQDEKFLKNNIKDIISLIDEYSIKELEDKYGVKKYNYEEKSDIKYRDLKTEFKHILINKPEREIKNDLLKSLFYDKEGNLIFDFNISTAGYMESYFHTIIEPKKYGVNKFSMIFNYYWICYFVIVKGIVKYLDKKQSDMKEFWSGNDLRYDEILHNINRFTRLLYRNNIDICEKGSYYELIQRKLVEKKDTMECIGIATTNYYKFCEIITEKTIYLNGQLKYFEFPEMLEVRDFNSDDNITNENLFFPFIFGQSLIKPIVNDVQICEFTKFKKLLKDIDILVILGYNINEDDNHINAMLHSYAKSDKRLIVVGEYNNDDEKKAVSQKLKCEEENIEYCTVRYGNNSEVINKMFNKILEGIK